MTVLGILTAIFVLLLVISGVAIRIALITNPKRHKPLRHGRRNQQEPTHLLIVLGSGGHTAEMLSMLGRAVSNSDAKARLDLRDFNYRTWVVGIGDGISAARAKAFEDELPNTYNEQVAASSNRSNATGPNIALTGTFDVSLVPRARAIHQSLLTAPVSSFKCLRACLALLTNNTSPKSIDFPDIILCNGPATATILIFASLVLRFFNVRGCDSRGKMRTIYVESWARVERLSLSGKLLCHVVDRFVVQWPQLEADARKGGGRAEFVGVLV